jgi:Fe-S oxidoreductase
MDPSYNIHNISLEECLNQVRENCSDCGLCVNECGFLEKYGSPKKLARNYDPEQKSFQVMPFECSLCGLCNAVCQEGLNPEEMFRKMRRESVIHGKGKFSGHDSLLLYERTGMSRLFTFYGLPESCSRVLFPGCAFAGTRPELTKKLFDSLKAEDQSLGIVLDCCGRISDDLGRENFSREMIQEMQDYLTGKAVSEVIVVCPNCYGMFRKYAGNLNVKTIFEALPQTGVSNPSGRSAVIHDPCSTRFSSSYHEMVRKRLMLSGINVQEMAHSGKTTLCCGGGAGVMPLAPEMSDGWLTKISTEAKSWTIITSCAGCLEILGKHNRCIHALDAIFDPDALTKKPKTPKLPIAFLNRLSLKRYFRKTIIAQDSRERNFMARTPEKVGRLFTFLFKSNRR